MPFPNLNHDIRAAAIARLNDEVRRSPGGGWVITAGVAARGGAFLRAAIEAVVAFDNFPKGDDPNAERDFGAFDVSGERLFWKIDCYDRELRAASADPADPAATRRVLTLMLAEEY